MRSTFKLLFYINRQKIKKNGKCPVMGRITLDGKVSQYSTGEDVQPKFWDANKGRAVIHGQNPETSIELRELNRKLEELEEKARTAYKKSVDSAGYVSAEIIKNAVTGKAQPKEHLLALFDEHNEEYAKRVGIDRTHHTYIRYLTTRKHQYNFLQYKYGVEDVTLRSIDMQFIENFHFYLSTILKLKTISLNDYLILLCKIVRLAVKRRILSRYPFTGYKLEIPPTLHRHLTGEQLAKDGNRSSHLPAVPHQGSLCLLDLHRTGKGRNGRIVRKTYRHGSRRLQMDTHQPSEDKGGMPYQTA